MTPDAVLFLVSQAYLSGKRFKTLQAGLTAACPIPCAVVRMEGRGEGPMAALDALAGQGANAILVQPVGVPFSDSLMAWLPGALAHWQRASWRQDIGLSLGRDQVDDASLLQAVATSALSRTATPIAKATPHSAAHRRCSSARKAQAIAASAQNVASTSLTGCTACAMKIGNPARNAAATMAQPRLTPSRCATNAVRNRHPIAKTGTTTKGA